MHAKAQLEVSVQFVCSLRASHPLRMLWGLHALICTGLAAAKAAQSFSGSGPQRFDDGVEHKYRFDTAPPKQMLKSAVLIVKFSS